MKEEKEKAQEPVTPAPFVVQYKSEFDMTSFVKDSRQKSRDAKVRFYGNCQRNSGNIRPLRSHYINIRCIRGCWL